MLKPYLLIDALQFDLLRERHQEAEGGRRREVEDWSLQTADT